MAASTGSELTEESIFTWGAPPLKFGAGAVDEIGFDMAQYGARRVLILTDPTINELGIPARIAESLAASGIGARPVTEDDIAGIFARSIQNW
jgi:hydroxyacid-oxoacid transhydrogenase